MDTKELLKKMWPTPYKIVAGNVSSLILQLVIFLVICLVMGFVIGLLAASPIIGVIFSLLGALVEIYGVVGIVLSVLQYLGKLE